MDLFDIINWLKEILIELCDLVIIILLLFLGLIILYFVIMGIKDITKKGDYDSIDEEFRLFKENTLHYNETIKNEIRILKGMMAGKVGSKQEMKFRKEYWIIRKEMFGE